MQITDELRVLVEAEVTRAIENFKKLSGGIDDAEKKSMSLGEALDSISKKSLIVSGIFGGAAVAAIKFAGENEKLKLSLKNMLGSAEEATAVFEQWRQLGSSPGLSADEVFSLGRAMVNMGHDTEYATQTMRMLGNVAAGTGVSFGEISGSFERARAMGNLTTRDLVRLQQQGIPIVKQLSLELGTSEENIRQLAAAGKIGFNDLENALKSMTAPGGQFAGMMDELSGTVLEKFSTAASDAKHALASFGEMLLPLATKLLDSASSVLRGITDMDEGTKRFILGMGGVIAVSGPAIAAIKGIHAAATLLMANPFMLAIGGIITATGVVAGLINKQANAYDDLQKEIKKTDASAKELLNTYSGGNDQKLLDEKITRDLIKLYPQLSGVISANTTTVREAAEAQEALYKQNVVASQQKRIDDLRRYQENLSSILIDIREIERQIANPEETIWDSALLNQMRNKSILEADETRQAINRVQDEINVVLSSIGKNALYNGVIIDIPVTVSADTSGMDNIPPALINLKKTWQEWFGEIAKIDPDLFGNSGAQAARLYIGEFQRGFTAQNTIAAALGEQLDVSGVLKSRQAEVQKALVELLSINPDEINQPFSLTHEAVSSLIREYQRLGNEITTLNNAAKINEYNKTIEELQKRITDFGKSESQLAYEAAIANGALENQAYQIAQLVEQYQSLEEQARKTDETNRIYDDLNKRIADFGKSESQIAYEAAIANGALHEQADEIRQLTERYQELNDEANKLDELNRIYDDLNKRIADFGKSESQIAYEAAIANGALHEQADEIWQLTERYQELNDEARKLNELNRTFDSLNKRIADFGKSESQIAYEAAIANGALHEQADEIRQLAEHYQELNDEARKLNELNRTFDSLNKRIADFGKSESQLAYEAAIANGALHEQADEIRQLTEQYNRLVEETKKIEDFERTITNLTKKIDDLGKSERQLAYEAELARLGLDSQSAAAVELAQVMDKLSVSNTLSSLSREIQNLGKDQYELALATMTAAGATEEEIKQAEEMINVLRRYGQSFDDFLSHKISSGLMDIFPNLEKQAAQAIGSISAKLSMMSFDGLLGGLNAIGEAFAKGENAAENLRHAMADMAGQILNQLPSMFLQAGLQLITQGQWPMGLAFIAAAGSSALIGGYVNGRIEKASENITANASANASANAHGNAFDTGNIVPFAHGGSFTNQIVNKPTYFRYGGRFGVMGEAGPESIMPLRRMANGDLGVASSGSGAVVTVNIINNAGVEIHKEERTDSNGNKQHDIVLGKAFNNHITSGRADNAMKRFGIHPTGV